MSKKKSRTFAVILTLLVLGGGCYFAIRSIVPRYDELVTQREEVRKEWAQIDALLQRRFNLIPNLVRTVKGYAGHEASLVREVADSHTGYVKARSMNARIKAAYRAERGISRCMVWGMRYPQLRADQTFVRLMGSLEKAEDAVASRRMAYNDAVSKLNANVNSAFGGFVAGLTGIESAPYYNPPKASAEVPEVDFSAGTDTKTPPATKPETKPAGLKLRDLSVAGLVRKGRGVGRAILKYPDGRTLVVKQGQSILEFRARVVSIDASGVTFEEKSIDGAGRTVSRTIRLNR